MNPDEAISTAPAADAPAKSAFVRVPELTVVVPTFNERANVALLVDRLTAILSTIAWEAIFVDDDSPDGTAALVKEIGACDPRVRCIRRVGRRGLSGACIEGMLASQARFVAVIDGDLQHDESLLPQMLRLLQEGQLDIVIGSRHVATGTTEGLSPIRRLGSNIAGRVANRVLGLDVADPLSGYFMIRRDIVEAIAPRLSIDGFKILLDVLVSTPQPLRVRELPISFRERHAGTSKLDSRIVLDFIGLLVAKATRDVVPIRFVSFLLVGASGIVVHLTVLKSALVVPGLSFPLAQTLATLVAMMSNFFLNNSLTYRDRRLQGLDALKGLLVFFVICAVGAISNIGVASWLYANEPVWWLAGLVGSTIGAVWNYALSSALVWRRRG
jgi:dolichol-phosphate mannosyltransferase